MDDTVVFCRLRFLLLLMVWSQGFLLTHSRISTVEVKDEDHHEQTRNDAEAGAQDEASIGGVGPTSFYKIGLW